MNAQLDPSASDEERDLSDVMAETMRGTASPEWDLIFQQDARLLALSYEIIRDVLEFVGCDQTAEDVESSGFIKSEARIYSIARVASLPFLLTFKGRQKSIRINCLIGLDKLDKIGAIVQTASEPRGLDVLEGLTVIYGDWSDPEKPKLIRLEDFEGEPIDNLEDLMN